ncbi:ADP-ribosylglycohydrolase family protein [Paenibacillus sp. GCM10023252]|uniref:ADP-ribosylglycohydrolase family protein n=1 Tax=Paenibacillus sp. GCM10023252 TaxID=3252649 RepID=UPI00360F5D79
MPRHTLWLNFTYGLHKEVWQAESEGREIGNLREEVERILALDQNDPERERLAAALLDRVQTLPWRSNYSYVEPSDLESIQAERSGCVELPFAYPTNDIRFDRVYGAWLGRVAGNLLGRAVEGWHREQIIDYMKETDNYPLTYYLRNNVDEAIKSRYPKGFTTHFINNVVQVPEDDDLNYSLVSLNILELAGPDFTPDDVMERWMGDIPMFKLMGAERVAYRNAANLIHPPHSAVFRNPDREAIGAQIRADFYGYIHPGNPERAAAMAWRDACVSHIKNGIYGSMFVAAMLAAAAATENMEKIVHAGLAQIPAKSRLYEEIEKVLSWYDDGLTYEEAFNLFYSQYSEKRGFDWAHTIPNAMLVVMSLLYGGNDFERAMHLTLTASFDTDCNCATVGSILGMAIGKDRLPSKWIQPAFAGVITGVDGQQLVDLQDITRRTIAIEKQLLDRIV